MYARPAAQLPTTQIIEIPYDRPPPYSTTDIDSSTTMAAPPPVPDRDYMIQNLSLDDNNAADNGNNDNSNNATPSSGNNTRDVCSSAGPGIDFNQLISDYDPSQRFSKHNHEVSPPFSFDKPIETNKFYGNMLLGQQMCPIWTHPYSLWLSRDPETVGMCIAYIRESQKVRGGGENGIPQFYFSPTNIRSFIMTAVQLCNETTIPLTLNNMKHMSCEVSLQSANDNNQKISFPVVQGMGFVTANYSNLTPQLNSMVGFRSIEKLNHQLGSKYQIVLEDSVTWTMYVFSSDQSLDFQRVNGNSIVANKQVDNCTIQLVVDTNEKIDTVAGCYPVDCELTGSIDDDRSFANYNFNYSIKGNAINSNNTLMYCLPHHMDYLNQDFKQNNSIGSTLDSTVCGKMNGFITNQFQMTHLPVPKDLSFDPMTTITTNGNNGKPKYSNDTLNKIKEVATAEINKCNVEAESNVDSMYFAGKVLAKYAWILYVVHSVLADNDLATNILDKLKIAIQRFIDNKQILPLVYDNTWKGMVSSGESSQDFGNSYFNDHHFHYAYHVIAASIIVKVERDLNNGNSEWLSQNKDWVECLIRDFANPSSNDPFFPVFRSFDWFNGHSWAKGLFESGDGKDQESSSEDVNASYALMLWGKVANNQNLENIGLLQLGILNSSFNHYCLYSNDNTTEPNDFIKNKVSGIIFENKIDHTTYFGNNLEYIQMIHAIPIIPPSSFIRSPTFVREEWDQQLEPILNNVNDGWKGIMMLNKALYDPKDSYDFFADPNFNYAHLDGGQSLTWSLAYSGAFI